MSRISRLKPAATAVDLSIFWVTRYGAIGDGVADDTDAIQQAIDAAADAGGGRVFMPIGTYKVSNTIRMRDGVELFGAGALSVLKPVLPNVSPNRIIDNDWATGSTNITLRNFRIDRELAVLGHCILFNGVDGLVIDSIEIGGGAPTTPGAGTICISGIGPADGAHLLSKHVRVVNCRLDDTGNYGIQVGYVDDAVIANNTMINAYREVVGVEPELACFARNVTITGNTIIGSAVANGTSTGLIVVTTNTGGDIEGVTVVGNALRQVSGGNTGNPGIQVNGGSGVIIANNTIRNMDGIGIKIGITGYDITDGVVVQGNTIIDCAQSTPSAGILLRAATRCSVYGNHIQGANHSASVAEDTGAENNVIAMNYLRDTTPVTIIHAGTACWGNKTTDGDKAFKVGHNASVTPTLTINGAASAAKRLTIQSAGLDRWNLEVSGTESGSNAGSDLLFVARDDTGASIGAAITINRRFRRLLINGGFAVNRTTTAVDYSIGTRDHLIAVTDTSVPRTLPLPSTANMPSGTEIIVKDESGGAGTNNITVTPAAGQNIQGASSIVIASNYGVVRLYSDGTNWKVLHTLTPTSTDTLKNKTLDAVQLTGVGAVAQGGTLAVHKNADQTTNYERGRLWWDSNVLKLSMEASGTGSVRTLQLSARGSVILYGTSQADGTIQLTDSTASGNIAIAGINGTLSSSSATPGTLQTGLKVSPTIAQSSAAGYTALQIAVTETSTGSGAKNLIDAQVGGVSRFKVDNAGVITAAGLVAPGLPYDMTYVQTVTTRTVGLGSNVLGIRVMRACQINTVFYRCADADASGNLSVELRKNGVAIAASQATIAAANQVAGVSVANVNTAFAVGDILTVYITAVGTSPGAGLSVDIAAVTA